MKNHAVINYNEKTLTLYFRWQTFVFDLTLGDIGDFWHGFETHDGTIYNVSYYEEFEEGEVNASVGVYGTIVDDDGELTIDSWNCTDIDVKETIGNANNYFNYEKA
jgi:hypothetical protein